MIKKHVRVPYGLSVHGNEEIKAVNKVLKNSTQMGKNVYEFEKRVAKLFDKKYGLIVDDLKNMNDEFLECLSKKNTNIFYCSFYFKFIQLQFSYTC